MLTLLIPGNPARVGSTCLEPACLAELHSSESHWEWDDVELPLDTCDAASENTDDVEEEAEEEREAAYGCCSAEAPKLREMMLRLILSER